jgi:hypothetical protein
LTFLPYCGSEPIRSFSSPHCACVGPLVVLTVLDRRFSISWLYWLVISFLTRAPFLSENLHSTSLVLSVRTIWISSCTCQGILCRTMYSRCLDCPMCPLVSARFSHGGRMLSISSGTDNHLCLMHILINGSRHAGSVRMSRHLDNE